TAQGTAEVALALDNGYLVGGPNPAWGGNGRDGGWVTPTASLALEEGWLDGEQYGPKSATPARDAAERFGELLDEAGLTVTRAAPRPRDAADALGQLPDAAGPPVAGGRPEAPAPEGAPTAQIHSETLAELVRHTLLISDNTPAELLAHLVALSRGEETTPAGAAAAVEAEIRELAEELGVAPEALDSLEIHDG